MMGPRVELELLVRLGDTLCERARPNRVARADLADVAAVRGGLADRNERLGAARLDPGVARGCELRVGSWAHDLAARVELGRQELAEIRLVPDPVEPDERQAGGTAGVAGGERLREVLEAAHRRGQEVGRLVAVRPLRRS